MCEACSRYLVNIETVKTWFLKKKKKKKDMVSCLMTLLI